MTANPSHVRIQRLAPGESAALWTKALIAFDAGSATVLKKEGGSAVYRTRLLNRDVIVKAREMRGLKDRLKLWTGKTRGHRHWNGAAWLMSHGLATARPYVLATENRDGVSREWLVLELLPGKTLLQHIADRDLSVKQEHEVARTLARQIAALTGMGRFNRDHKPSNLILMSDSDKFAPSIIDCVAIRPGKDGTVRMLHALAVEPLGLAILPRRALLARVVHALVEAEHAGVTASLTARRLARWASRRAYWGIVSNSLHEHGDARPQTNPLSSSSR